MRSFFVVVVLQVGLLGERVQVPILGIRSSAYRLGTYAFRKTASTKKECTCIRSMHVYPRVGGGFYHLMARALLDRTVGCGVNNSHALRFSRVDWVGLVVGFA